MPDYHIGVVKFFSYSVEESYGYVRFYPENTNTPNDKRFTSECIYRAFRKDDVVYFADEVIFLEDEFRFEQRCQIYHLSNDIRIPWKELLGYVTNGFTVYNDKSGNSVNILNPFLEHISPEEFNNLICVLHGFETRERVLDNDSIADLLVDKGSVFFEDKSISQDSRCILKGLLDIIFKTAVDNNKYRRIKRVLSAYYYPSYYSALANKINDLIDQPSDLYIFVKGLFEEDACFFDEIERISNVSFYKEIHIILAALKNDISIIGDADYKCGTDNFHCILKCLSDNEFLFLGKCLNEIDDFFISTYCRELRERSDIFRSYTADSRRVFLFLVETRKDDVISSLIRESGGNDDFLISCSPYYPRFSDDIKRDYLQSLTSTKRTIDVLTTSAYTSAPSIADVLSIDVFYKRHPELWLQSDLILGEDARQFVLFRERGLINDISISTKKRIISNPNHDDDARLESLYILFSDNKTRIEAFLHEYMRDDTTLSNLYFIKKIEREIAKNCIILGINGNMTKAYGLGYVHSFGDVISVVDGDNIRDIIKSKEIVIGYDIRDRLKTYGEFEKDNFFEEKIWDTLAIQILLYPNSTSFTLQAYFDKKDDNHVCGSIKTLFLTQVYMILGDKDRFDRVKPYLPKFLIGLFETTVNLPDETFKKYDDINANLFYEPDSRPSVDVSNDYEGLIIVSKQYWQSDFLLSNSCYFIDSKDNDLDIYNHLDLEKLKECYHNPKDIYEGCLLMVVKEYIDNNWEINISQIPRLIRKHIGDETLSNYVLKNNESGIVCISPYDMLNPELRKREFNNIIIFKKSFLPMPVDLAEEEVFQILSRVDDYDQDKRYIPLLDKHLNPIIKKESYMQYWPTRVEPNVFRIIRQISWDDLETYIKKRFPGAKITLNEIS